jgi:hypothetical protein
MMTKLAVVVASAAALALLSVVPAAAAQSAPAHTWHRSCTATGALAICTVTGTVNHPKKIWVHVTAQPNQQVQGHWTMSCSKGTGARTKSGNIAGMTPLTHLLPMPYKLPKSCTVSADAQLTNVNGNTIKVVLTAPN